MAAILLTLAMIGQQPHGAYHFRALPIASGQWIAFQAPPPSSPQTNHDKNNPYGFTAFLNGTRRMYGLRPLTYDARLAEWAALNNLAQRSQSKAGHFVMGPARRQNAAVITGDISAYVGRVWMDSPEHRAALLDPGLARFGLAWDGLYWTWDAR